ncbi:hypothetical protein [Priestia filamentosa]|uniref:hypothetical protein n=1 Tax=Priestia filamentosa TaxID=1402861 RepID=UPI002895A2A2|nr:hypothetical protein [Priestia filamentosa]MDT3766161.1 hypothetical protein [Priestia filamentosa]
MKKYRLGYDYLLLANESFNYKNESIGAMSVNVMFKLFDIDGQEILFEDEELRDQKLYFKDGKSCYLCNLLICSIDRESIVHFEPNRSLIQKGNYDLQWEIDSYTKDLDKGILEPEIISEDEFRDIIKNNIDAFDNIDNRSAQTTAYFTEEIYKEEGE